jgi:hypothetical protein
MTGKTIQKQMFGIRSELYYELTTPIYSDDINNVIYLAPVEDTETDMLTTVRRKSALVIPLLFYNRAKNTFNVTLGATSLIQSYREFLTDALLVECNSSTCFELITSESSMIPDSAFVLNVKVNKNITSASMIYNEVSIFYPVFDGYHQHEFSSWNVKQPDSWLEISVQLTQNGKILWADTYSATHDLPYNQQDIAQQFNAFEMCVSVMTECLSYSTNDAVEQISRDLHQLMLSTK